MFKIRNKQSKTISKIGTCNSNLQPRCDIKS